jgi:hypothetical protein
MVRVQKEYRFEGPDGEVGLLDLFEGRRQLIVYRSHLDPDMQIANYPEDGCPGCTMFADNLPKLIQTERARYQGRRDRPPALKREPPTRRLVASQCAVPGSSWRSFGRLRAGVLAISERPRDPGRQGAPRRGSRSQRCPGRRR